MSEEKNRTLVAKLMESRTVARLGVIPDFPLNPNSRDLCWLHYVLFSEVQSDAGRMRSPGKSGMVPGGRYGADAQRLGVEMDLLKEQMQRVMAVAETPGRKVMAMSFYVSRLNAIAPFERGNERLAAMVVEAQSRQLLGKGLTKPLDYEQFRKGLEQARLKDDLGCVYDAIVHSVGVEAPRRDPLPGPYQVRARYPGVDEPPMTLGRELEATRKEGPDMRVSPLLPIVNPAGIGKGSLMMSLYRTVVPDHHR